MKPLIALGWGPHFAAQLPDLDALERVGRVIEEDIEGYFVAGLEGTVRAIAPGKLRRQADNPLDCPTVGDWVLWQPGASEVRTIDSVLERKTCLVRGAAGRGGNPQALAANVDVVFVVTSMNQEFNLRRLERYLTAIWESGATPVIVLNKADLADDPVRFIAEAQSVAPDVAVVALSARDGDGLERIEPFLGGGTTIALVGSSGVGKSTITNALIGERVQLVRDIRSDDDEGRHTTTARRLLPLGDGHGVVVDTPGIRELRLWVEADAVDRAFDDVVSLAESCRFRDCSHGAEPGCAVQEAIADGTLDAARLESYHKLLREVAAGERKRNVAARRAYGKQFSRMVRGVKKHKKR